MEYHGYMERGTFAHTCHKTDPRADSPEGKRFKGAPRHCAGALAMQMQSKMPYQDAFDQAILDGRCEPRPLRDVKGVWPSFPHMVRAYVRWMKAGIPVGRFGSEYFKPTKLRKESTT